jgi:hypothetical protein
MNAFTREMNRIISVNDAVISEMNAFINVNHVLTSEMNAFMSEMNAIIIVNHARLNADERARRVNPACGIAPIPVYALPERMPAELAKLCAPAL